MKILIKNGVYIRSQLITNWYNFESEFDAWGDVIKGDKLPYLPENILFASAGVAGDNWGLTFAARYTGDIRTEAGQGDIAQDYLIKSKTIVDLSGRYFISDAQEVYLSVENLFDEKYVTTKIHGSNFAGKPMTISIGYAYKF
ncbi:TonB-dependent receptor [Shewanella halifaxensis]|uniref:TonB-dependent receptor n=1 Tax=Shewanella halifaxensis TaxID=271098 RepID=UPI001F40DE5D|nr:TonB-dependent receptor [Shewanella halifaxensis]